MEPPSREFQKEVQEYTARQREVARWGSFNLETIKEYADSLDHPFECISKIPLGFPVHSCSNSLKYRLPVSMSGTTLKIGGSTITMTTAGSTVAFAFNPNLFDADGILKYSCTATGPLGVLFTDWTNLFVSKGFSSTYSSYRLVSAGCRLHCTTAPLYTRGYVTYSVTNARTVTEFGAGSGGYTAFFSDPDTVISALHPGLMFEIPYTPIDDECLSFISTTTIDSARQDWMLFFALDGYDATNGFTGIIELVCNYELITFASQDALIPTSYNPGGESAPVYEVLSNRDKKKKKESYKDARPPSLPMPVNKAEMMYYAGKKIYDAF